MRVSLRYKFILAFVAFTALLSTLFGAIAAQRLSRQLEEQATRYGLNLAEHAAEEVLESYLIGQGHDPILLAQRLLSEDVVYAQIVVEGRVIAQQMRSPVELPLLDLPDRLLVQRVNPPRAAPYLDIVQPLAVALALLTAGGHRPTTPNSQRWREGVPGYVRLGFSLALMQQEVQREFLLITAVSLIFILLGILLAWGLYRMILSPVERLTEAVRHFGQGGMWFKPRVRSGDELEALADEFNLMARAIVRQRDELRRTNEALGRANRVKSDFLATVSHELRTPLHSILGYANLLLDEVNVKLNETGRQYAQAIRNSGRHLLELIGGLLQFSKLESGSERLNLSEVDAASVVSEAVENQKPLAQAKSLPLEVEIEDRPHLLTDATKLKQVLINLINNAVKFTERGRVRVTVRPQGRAVHFAVSDTGVGIDLAKVGQALYAPFERGAAPPAGVGLGLAVAKRYVEMMGGSLHCESAPGRGSTFRFTLPQDPRQQSANENKDRGDATPPG